MYENSFRLRGKTYDYKIPYDNIRKFFILPKNDELHTMITMGLEPPLRQGQTRYPFIVMQMKLDEEINLDLNLTDESLQNKYKDRLESHYEAPAHHVISKTVQRAFQQEDHHAVERFRQSPQSARHQMLDQSQRGVIVLSR